ncbi:MAG TPA: hypothetical protein D7H94_01520 [Candidatus Poseidoniales archaeon]|nr:MAG TPA: hypothetical protein D7H94_01520 [Candidatus Poseidoniales archaeon]|tara:strand:- start:762 stop:995 length:234 start_codon:yes stop_codon:yes gene_type:complete
MEEDRMSNITLKILDLTGDTVLADLDADAVRAEVNALDGERWVFVDGRMVRRDNLANIDIAENATVLVTRQMVAGSV